MDEKELEPKDKTYQDSFPEIDLERISKATKELLYGVGENPEREGLLKTPDRVARAFEEITSGYRMDPEALINKALFDVKYDEMVVVHDIYFYSMCEHHILPRIVDMFSRRLQVQERMTRQIAEFLEEHLHPQGVAVVIQGQHLCMQMRGVRKPRASMTTSAMRGVFRSKLETRMEFLNQIKD